MKKVIAFLLFITLMAGLACAYARPLAAGDLVGSWHTVYEDIIPISCYLYEEMTFDAEITDDLPIDENLLSGTWEFDGETLVLHCGEEDLPFVLDGLVLRGRLFGLEVELSSEWMGDYLESILASAD